MDRGGDVSEENKAAIRQFVDTLNRHDLDGLDTLVAEDVSWHGGSFGEIEGREAFKQLVGAFVGAFPDLRIDLGDLVAERDLVAARFTTTGTQKGEILGVPATGKQAQWNEQPVYRLDGGTVREVWWIGDAFGLMQQLGAIPAS